MSHLRVDGVEQSYLGSAITLISLEVWLTPIGVFKLTLTSCAGISPQESYLKSDQEKYIFFRFLSKETMS